uniref:RRM domain-containing protein n=2 Tax=Oryza TaxID=4527 RepID=A0A0D3H1K9_9ORYZ
MDFRRRKPPKDGRVFVRGLAAGTAGEADLLRHFDRYGVVDEVSIPRVVGEVDSLTGLPALRFAIVKFGHPEFAGLALDDREQVIDGQTVAIVLRLLLKWEALLQVDIVVLRRLQRQVLLVRSLISQPVELGVLQEQSMRKRDDVLQILPRGSSWRVDSFHVFSQVLESKTCHMDSGLDFNPSCVSLK